MSKVVFTLIIMFIGSFAISTVFNTLAPNPFDVTPTVNSIGTPRPNDPNSSRIIINVTKLTINSIPPDIIDGDSADLQFYIILFDERNLTLSANLLNQRPLPVKEGSIISQEIRAGIAGFNANMVADTVYVVFIALDEDKVDSGLQSVGDASLDSLFHSLGEKLSKGGFALSVLQTFFSNAFKAYQQYDEIGIFAFEISRQKNWNKGKYELSTEKDEFIIEFEIDFQEQINFPTHVPDSTSTPLPTSRPTSRPNPTHTPKPLGYNQVYSNSDWDVYSAEDRSGSEMVLVPVGCFKMGNDDGDFNERPESSQCIDEPFWIDKYEVTNAQYGQIGSVAGSQKPRDSVTWLAAQLHCESRGARLPTELEWEYAARGPSNWMYPWGNRSTAGLAVYNKNQTQNVGSGSSLSWVGAADMLGNLWEWTSTKYIPESNSWHYPYDAEDGREDRSDTQTIRIARGGSAYDRALFSATYRLPLSPFKSEYGVGFRCVHEIR